MTVFDRVEVAFEARPGLLEALAGLVSSAVEIERQEAYWGAPTSTTLGRVVEVKAEHHKSRDAPLVTVVIEEC